MTLKSRRPTRRSGLGESDQTARRWSPAACLFAFAFAFLGFERAASAEELAFELVHHETPADFYVGYPLTIEVAVKNTGELAWSEAAGDRLSYHWRDAEGEMLVLDGARTHVTSTVGPGESVEFAARVLVPREPGQYILEWRMVRENVHWFPRPAAGEQTRIEVQVARDPFVWEIDALRVDAEVGAGEVASYQAQIRNVGAATWSEEDRDYVSYRWWTADGARIADEGRRSSLSEDVTPDGSTTIDGKFVAPKQAGVFRLEVEPVRENVAWYGAPRRGARLSEEVSISPSGRAWDLLEHDTPNSVASVSTIEVALTVRNSGREAWEGQDRLSYRWRDEFGAQVLEGGRTHLPFPVEPGEAIELLANLETPQEPGSYTLYWEMVQEGIRWFGPASGPLAAPLQVTVGPPSFAWSMLAIEEVPPVWVNGRHKVKVTLRNDGGETWQESTGDHLAYHWLDEAGDVAIYDGRRTRLPRAVAPGESIELEARIRGPRTTGDYQLEFEMVREGVTWFGPPAPVESVELRRDVVVRWFSGTLQWLMLVTSGLLALGVRRLRARRPESSPWLIDLLLLTWAWLALVLTAVTFAELSGIGFWSGGLLATWSGAALLPLMAVLLGARWRAWMLALGLLVTNLLVLADLVYMHFYGSIVPLTALTAAHHLHEVQASIVALFEPSYSWLAPTCGAALLVGLSWPRSNPVPRAKRNETKEAKAEGSQLEASKAEFVSRKWAWLRRRSRWLMASLWLAVCLPAAYRLYTVMSTDLGIRVFSEQRNAARLGVLNAHLFDAARTVREMIGREASAEQLATITDWYAARAEIVESQAETIPGRGVAKGKNLLLIQVESAQEFLIGAQANGQDITPFMNRLHERGLAYENLVDQTAQGKTSDGEYAVLSSQHPLRSGALCFLRADNDFVTLAHVLAEQGYSTFSAHPYKRGFWNRAILHPRYGFARSMFRRELEPGPNVGWGLADGPFLEQMTEELRTLETPFFAFLITLSLHHPYDEFPEQFMELNLGELEGTRLGNYLHAMNYFDRSLEDMFLRLERSGLAKNTVVALYGDHDARLELGAPLLSVAGEDRWSPAVFHRLERVPFFVVLPGDAPAGKVETVGGQVDIGPTLLHYLGVERPQSFMGRPIPVDPEQGFAAYPDGSAFAHDRTFVGRGHDIPRDGACFDADRGTSRPRGDCQELSARAADELANSRAVLDFDLHRALARPQLVDSIESVAVSGRD